MSSVCIKFDELGWVDVLDKQKRRTHTYAPTQPLHFPFLPIFENSLRVTRSSVNNLHRARVSDSKNRKYESDHVRRICPKLQICTEKDFGIVIILGKCATFSSIEKTKLRMSFSFVYRTKSVSTHIQSSLHRQSISFISFSRK